MENTGTLLPEFCARRGIEWETLSRCISRGMFHNFHPPYFMLPNYYPNFKPCKSIEGYAKRGPHFKVWRSFNGRYPLCWAPGLYIECLPLENPFGNGLFTLPITYQIIQVFFETTYTRIFHQFISH
jgi:hypothetical protein